MTEKIGLFTPQINSLTEQSVTPGADGGTQTPTTGGVNPFSLGVVKELVSRGRKDVAREHYPFEYSSLYGDDSPQPNTGLGTITTVNPNTRQPITISVPAEIANRYNTQDWGVDARYDPTPLNNGPTDEDKAYGERLAKVVDYNQLGGINGSKNTKGYQFFDKSALLPSLFARKLGLTPEEVLAINPYDREEAARKLLTDYYANALPVVKAQIGNPEQWINGILSHYGISSSSTDMVDDNWQTTLKNLAKGTWQGLGDAVDDKIEGVKTLFGADMTEEERAQIKAEREEQARNRTPKENALLQRFDSLMANGNYVDAATFVATNPDMWGAMAGSTVGSAILDALVTSGVIVGAGSAATLVSGGLAAAPTVALEAANLARVGQKLSLLAKAGTFAGVSGLGMMGNAAKEIKLDGNTIPVGSDAYKMLIGYGLLGGTLSALPGTFEQQLLSRIMKSKAGAGLTEDQARNAAAGIIKELEKVGYKQTADGMTRSAKRSVIEWGKRLAAHAAAEGGTEYIQEGAGAITKQVAGDNGTVNIDNIDLDAAHKAGMQGAVLGTLMGGGLHALPGNGHRQAEDVKLAIANDELKRQAEVDNKTDETPVEDEQFTAFVNSLPPETIENIRRKYTTKLDTPIESVAPFEEWRRDNEASVGLGVREAAEQEYRYNHGLGDERLFEGAHQTPEFQALMEQGWRAAYDKHVSDLSQQVDEDAVQAELRRLYEGVDEQPTDGVQSEAPGVDDTRIKNAERTSNITTTLASKGFRNVHTKIDPFKDLDQPEAAKRWNTVKRALEALAKQKKNEAGAQVPPPLPANHPLFAQRQAEIAAQQARIRDAETTAKNLREAVDAVDTSDNINALREVLADYADLLSDKASHDASELLGWISNANATNKKYNDKATRWNTKERGILGEHLLNIARDLGVDEYSPRVDDLPAAIDHLQRLAQGARYRGNVQGKKALKRLEFLDVAVQTNHPELLSNYKGIESHLKGEKADKSRVWDDKSVAYNYYKKKIKDSISKLKQAGIIEDPELDFLKDEVDALYDSNPLAMTQILDQRLGDIAQLLTSSPITDPNVTNAQINTEKSALNFARMQILDLDNALRHGDGTIKKWANPVTVGKSRVGKEWVDMVTGQFPYSEINRYAQEVEAIAANFGAKPETPFSADTLQHIAELESAVDNPPANYNTSKNNLSRDTRNDPATEAKLKEEVKQYLSTLRARINAVRQHGYSTSPGPVIIKDDSILNGVIRLARDDDPTPFRKATGKGQPSEGLSADARAVIDNIITESTLQPIEDGPAKTPGTGLAPYNPFIKKQSPAWPVEPDGTVAVADKTEVGKAGGKRPFVRATTMDKFSQQGNAVATLNSEQKANILYRALRGEHVTIGEGVPLVTPKGVTRLYSDVRTAIGPNATPESMAEFLSDGATTYEARYPSVGGHANAMASVGKTLSDIDKVTTWIDTTSPLKTDKTAKAAADVLIGEMNNHAMRTVLQQGGADIRSLRGLLAKTVWVYDKNPDTKALATFFGQALNSEDVLNTTVKVIGEKDKVIPTDVLGAYHRDTNTIYVRDGEDISKTLLHELSHAIIADKIKDAYKFTANAAANKRVQGFFTDDTNAEARELLESVGVLNSDATVNVEELVVRTIDEIAGVEEDVPGLNAALRQVRTAYIPTVSDKATFLDAALSAQTTIGKKITAKLAAAVNWLRNKPSPVNDGFRYKRKAKKNPFKAKTEEDRTQDTATVFHFGFNEDNQMVSADPMAWWDGQGWNFYYVDAEGNPNHTRGIGASDMFQMAQDLDLFVDQREKDVILSKESERTDQFEQFSPPIGKMWKNVNRLFGGNDEQVHPLVRGIMNYTQKWAVEQMGIDQFFKFFENVLTHKTGTDQEGILTTQINKIRTKMNYLTQSVGVSGDKTLYDMRNELEDFLAKLGWSREKVDNTLYAMRAGIYHYELEERQQTHPKWPGQPVSKRRNLTGFSWKGADDKVIDDSDGSLWMAALSEDDKKIASALRELVTQLNNGVLQAEYQSGRISEEAYNSTYNKFYVPLRNDDDKATAFQRQGVGRHTKADSPLSHLLANHQARMAAVEQSMILQSFLDLLEQHPIKGFALVNSSSLKNNGKGEYAMSADGFLEGTTMTLYRNGKKVTLNITHPIMAEAIKKRKAQAASNYLNTMTRITGLMGLSRTGLPTFAKTAFFRDLTMSFVNVQAAFRGQEKMSDAEWLALGTKTGVGMMRYLPMIAKARLDMNNADWRYKVYRSEGGIGNATAYDIDSVNAALERDIFNKNSTKNRTKRGFRKYFDVLHASDDAARFALWMGYLEKKHGSPFTSETQLVQFLKDNPNLSNIARDASKNITGNFEQRGMSRRLRSHYIFWSAIQAGMRGAYGLLNPRYGTYGIKAMSALAAYMMLGGDDEEDEDGKLKSGRAKGLGDNLRIGDVQVNFAQELLPVTHLATAIKYYGRGDWDFQKAFDHVANGIAKSVVPWQMAETGNPATDLAYALVPTIFQPLVLQSAGVNYFGNEIAPTPYDSNGNKWMDAPDAFRATTGTTGLSDEVARGLYDLTGGVVDVAPNSLDMFMQQGLGSLFSVSKDIVKRMNAGENLLEASANQFTKGHTTEYNVFALKDETEDRFKKAMTRYRIGDDDTILGKNDWPPEYQELKDLYDEMSAELKALTGSDGSAKMSDLFGALNQLKQSDSPSPDEFLRITNEIESLSQARNYVYGKYNRILLNMGY